MEALHSSFSRAGDRKIDQNDNKYLRALISEKFNEVELRELCFDIGIDAEELVHQTKSDLVMSLITYCDRRDQTHALIEKLSELRPQTDWPPERADKPKKDEPIRNAEADPIVPTHSRFYNEMAQITYQIEQGETWLGMTQLRNLIALRLQTLAQGQDLEIRNVPPMHQLRKLEEAHILPGEVAAKLEYALSVADLVIQKIEVSIEEVLEAVEEAASGLKLTEREAPFEARFEIKQARDEKYYFVFKDAFGEVVLRSNPYHTKPSVKNGIQSVLANLKGTGRIKRLQTKDGRHYFHVVAANAQIIAISQFYDSLPALEESLTSIMKAINDAPIVDLVE